MGSVLSGDETKFKEFYAKLTEQKLPLNLCFIVYKSDSHVNLENKIIQIIEKIEEKYVNKKNNYALISNKNSNALLKIDFCDYNQFVSKISLSYCNKQILYELEPSDLYNHAYLGLNWRRSIKILLDININQLETESFYRSQLINNFDVRIYPIETDKQLDLILASLNIVESKHVEAKYVPLYKFPTISGGPNKQEYFAKAQMTSFNLEKLSRAYVNEFDMASLVENDDLLRSLVDVWIEDNPFAQGNEIYCFMGWILNEKTKYYDAKVFKLAKFVEINLMDNFLAQTIARYLATEFSNTLIMGFNLFF